MNECRWAVSWQFKVISFDSARKKVLDKSNYNELYIFVSESDTLNNVPSHTSSKYWIHWNRNVFILIKFSSLAALEVGEMTTSSAASDGNYVKMMIFSYPSTLHISLLMPWFLMLCHRLCVPSPSALPSITLINKINITKMVCLLPCLCSGN